MFAGQCAAAGDVTVIVGLKGWFVDVDSDVVTNGQTASYSAIDPSMFFGPTITIRKDRLFLGINQFSGELKFLNDQPGSEIVNGTEVFYEFDLSIQRDERDLYVGYDIHPNFSLLVGHKTFDFTGKITDFRVVFPNNIPLDNIEADAGSLKGIFLGVSGHTDAPSNGGIMYFFTFAQADLEGSSEGITTYAKGPALEIGAAFIPQNSRFIWTLGYKIQTYDFTESGSNDTGTDEYYGLSGSVNYVF